MVLYFTGTGNTEYTAKRIGKEIQDETLNLFEKIRSHDYSKLYSDKPWVIAAPTYAWRIPRILEEWITNTKLCGNRDIYVVMTCAGSIADAGAHVKKLCLSKGMNYLGCTPVCMPENYIALFRAPDREMALDIIKKAESHITGASEYIKNRKAFPEVAVTLKDRMSSTIVNKAFYPVFVHAKKFYVTDACTSCGKCEKLCPMNNIRLESGRPVWRDQCTHCMACISRCPCEAIEYGKHSRGLPRYTCPVSLR